MNMDEPAAMADSTLIFLLLGATLAAFVWGRLRYDLVALSALLAAVALGLVPANEAFLGFGHPAVITVAAVLVLSRGFERAGVVDLIAGQTLRVGRRPMLQILVLTSTVLVLSGLMNNVGALALMLPVALRMAREHDSPPSLLLMPLAFGSLLGGLLTLIGTPPNIIISSYRNTLTGNAFGMFDFFPVGAAVAVVGLLFLVLVSGRLVPRRIGSTSTDAMFDTAHYLVELDVPEDGKAVGWSLSDLRESLGDNLPVLMVVRGENRYPGYAFYGRLRPGDILLMEAGPDEMKLLADKAGLSVGHKKKDKNKKKGTTSALAESADKTTDAAVVKDAKDAEPESAQLSQTRSSVDTEDLQLIEAVIRNDSLMLYRTAGQLRLRNQYGLHLVAVARDGTRLNQRLREIRFRAGDVLLLQGDEQGIAERLSTLGCLPLARRDLALGKPRRMLLSLGIFASAIAAMVLGLAPAAVALSSAAVISLMAGVMSLRDGYQAIDGSVIVLLGAMIPVGQALETSGGAAMIAQSLLLLGNQWPIVATMFGLFLIGMLLSNVVNNAAAALLMAPVAVSLAKGFEVSMDPFLMVVAVSASCAFMTPIGHQSNTLVMGPGGYRFGDYWKLGLPISLLVMLVAVPMVLLVWPL
ncbi:SLC13 family permease [Halomonas halocynthiae]|uniref:SLC13 family permease n=1 Tax=Halomonas halocynthiae TaxID=176290 RepID=UPI001F0AD416|nr:SLC13 family permease [Halomonas halocynthiae]